MKSIATIANFLTFFVTLFPTHTEACTAFSMRQHGRILVGKSYDWFAGHGHGALFVNPRGRERKALNLDQSPHPARWIANLGSVTFTQFGKDLSKYDTIN